MKRGRVLRDRPIFIAIALAFGLIVPFTLIIFAASSPQIRPAAAENPPQPVITIGVGASLSVFSEAGQPQLNAVQLAIDETNAAGGVHVNGVTHTLALVSADSACDPTQGAIAAQTLLDAGVVAVIGHTCSGASVAAAPLYHAAGVPMISASSSSPYLTEMGHDTTFRVFSRDDSHPLMFASFLRQWAQAERAALVQLVGFWGEWAIAPTVSAYTSLGGTITSHHILDDTGQFTSTLTLLQGEQPQAVIYFDDNPENAGLLSRIAHDLGMNDVLVGWMTLMEDDGDGLLQAYVEAAGPAAEGDYVMLFGPPVSAMPGYGAFRNQYIAAGFPEHGDEPGVYGAYAYDAARILIAAINNAASPSAEDIRDAIMSTANYHGVVGLYKMFDQKGDVVPQRSGLFRYRHGEWSMLSPVRAHLPLTIR